MSLIERAADILAGSTGESKKASPVTSASSDTPRADVLGRDVASGIENRLEGLERLDDKAAIEEATKIAGSPSLVKVDFNRLRQQNILTPSDARTPIAENFRRIKRHLLSNVGNPNAGEATNLVMITSALPHEGKTFCAINLAISIAMEVDRTVLLVDADVARPSISTVLGIPSAGRERGLLDILAGEQSDVAAVLRRTNIGKLTLLPAGRQHDRATEMLASVRMRSLLEDLAQRYQDRVIIFDTPPLLAASEAAVLAGRMGQILVVVEAGRTTETVLRDALAMIETQNPVGVVLNKGWAGGAGYGAYSYGYGYG